MRNRHDHAMVKDIRHYKRYGDLEEEAGFSISDFDRALVKAGGWVEYADAKY